MKKLVFVFVLLLLVSAGCGKEEAVKETKPIEVGESVAEKEDPEIIEAAEVREPLEVKPGNYTFGEDIKTGRYNITSQGLEEGTVYVKNQEGFIEVAEYFKTETE